MFISNEGLVVVVTKIPLSKPASLLLSNVRQSTIKSSSSSTRLLPPSWFLWKSSYSSTLMEAEDDDRNAGMTRNARVARVIVVM
jgi:hypothetical protein